MKTKTNDEAIFKAAKRIMNNKGLDSIVTMHLRVGFADGAKWMRDKLHKKGTK